MFYICQVWKTICCHYVRQPMCLWMLFVIPKSIFISWDRLNWLKQCWNLLRFCKVYLQCGIIIQRVVTIHGLPSVQLSRMMNLKIEFARISVWVQFDLLRWFQLLELIQQESIIKTRISCDFTIWPPLCSWPIFFNIISTPDCKTRVKQQ